MTSPLFALFAQSVSKDAHSKATYWTRAGLCGVTIFLFLIIAQNAVWPVAPGLLFFILMVTLQTGAISLIGLSYFGSAIAEEKEEETLGLLRMTDLSPVLILLGKSTSRLCGALLLLTAAFPFTIFAVTLGGVSLDQVIAAYGTIAAYTFLLCNVALLGSVVARHTAGAATFTAVIIGVYLLASSILESLAGLLGKSKFATYLDSLAETVWAVTPTARLREILTTGFSGSPIGRQVVFDLAAGTVFFFLAWAAFGHFCDRAPATPAAGSGGSMRAFGLRVRRPPRPEKHAIAWKDFYFLCGGHPGLFARVFGFLVIPIVTVSFLLITTSSHLANTISFYDSWVFLIFLLDAGIMASRVFRSELNEQTLSALAILPGTIRRIAYHKARLMFLILLPGAIATIGATVFQRWLGPYPPGAVAFQPTLVLQILSEVATGIVYLHAVVWCSLVMKRGALPVGIVFTVVLVAIVSIATSYFGTFIGYRFWASSGLSYRMLNYLVPTVVYLALAIILHLRSLRRLEMWAGAD